MDFMDLISTVLAILTAGWQGVLISLLIGAAMAWIAKHILADHPRAISMVVTILEALEDTLKQILGDRWAPVYDAILMAGQASIDGNVTQEEAHEIAVGTFDAALKLTGVVLTPSERTVMIGVLSFIVSALVQDKKASRAAIQSVRAVIRAKGVI